MSFSVSFSLAVSSGVMTSASVNVESDADYETLVMEACEALAGAKGSKFHIGGFGSDEWSLDIAYDLSVFMEQLPELLAGIRDSRTVEVDLYSQGIERSLTFQPDGDLVKIHCQSRTAWVPSPECEVVARVDLIAMLLRLTKDFAMGLKAVNSELVSIAPFGRWLEGEA